MTRVVIYYVELCKTFPTMFKSVQTREMRSLIQGNVEIHLVTGQWCQWRHTSPPNSRGNMGNSYPVDIYL